MQGKDLPVKIQENSRKLTILSRVSTLLSMKNLGKNYAYIDGANLHKGVEQFGWNFDYGRFRVWLREKYRVEQAYLFLGLIPKYKNLYTRLQEQGFTLIFKEVTYDGNGRVKGNCDADIVVRVMQDAYENNFDMAILVSSDGDYASLVSFLLEKRKLNAVLSPAIAKKCSILLKRTGAKISYLDDQKSILEAKEKAPDTDGTV
ncbi:MAG: NYN domain-containing protein [Patescibacteria group bacterium]